MFDSEIFDGEIVVLKGLEGLRTRPMMYLEDFTSPAAVNKLLEEALCIGLHALQMGEARRLEVQFHDDGSASVNDDSSGLDLSPDRYGMRFPEQLLTQLYACSHHKAEETKHFCGVGVVCANAFSTWLQMDVFKDGVHWQQTFREGAGVKAFAPVGDTTRQGNCLRFLPDPSFFKFPEFERALFARKFSELKLPNTGVVISRDLERMIMTRSD
jgi:DNA gyrase subunit B